MLNFPIRLFKYNPLLELIWLWLILWIYLIYGSILLFPLSFFWPYSIYSESQVLWITHYLGYIWLLLVVYGIKSYIILSTLKNILFTHTLILFTFIIHIYFKNSTNWLLDTLVWKEKRHIILNNLLQHPITFIFSPWCIWWTEWMISVVWWYFKNAHYYFFILQPGKSTF